jgi:anti-sigma regulatory factor (Ser/Thr protein kinase)
MVSHVVWSERMTLPPIRASVPAARSFVQDLLTDHNLQYLVEDVRLVTSELATNAARHAKTSFTVMLEGLSDSIRLTVEDHSRLRPVLSTVPVLSSTGRGLHVVGYYSREWGVRQGKRNGKSVWAAFDLHATPAPRLAGVSNGHRTLLPRPPAAQASTVPSVSRQPLSSLLNDVKGARADLRAARATGRPELVFGAQAHLVASLTHYVEALASLRLPVPYALRDELRINGRTLGASGARTPWSARRL